MTYYHEEFAVGSHVVWPNGVLGKVAAIDPDEDALMDECGAWQPAYDCSLYVPRGAA